MDISKILFGGIIAVAVLGIGGILLINSHNKK